MLLVDLTVQQVRESPIIGLMLRPVSQEVDERFWIEELA
jgi:hypothetical protein